jgi:hypothetical protein
MNDDEINLDTALTKTTVVEYNRFKIKSVLVNLNSTAKITVLVLPTDTNNTMICKTIEMTPAEYALWGENDQYVINYIKSYLAANI